MNRLTEQIKGAFDELYDTLQPQIDRSKKIRKRGRPKNSDQLKKRGRKQLKEKSSSEEQIDGEELDENFD